MARIGEPRERGGPFLSVVIEHTEVQRVPLTGPITMGRSLDCDLWLDDPRLSRQHARLEHAIEGDGWAVVDLNSRNGTFVNAKRVHERQALNHKDTITIGRAHLIFFARGYMPQRPAGIEEALRMSPNRSAMQRTGRDPTRPLPTPKVSNADTIGPGDPNANGFAKPLPFTRPPAKPMV